MTTDLLNHLWQSTCVTAVIALLARVLRHNRGQVRYALWFIASMKFLIPFAWLATAAGVFASSTAVAQLPSNQEVTPELVVATLDQFARPFEALVAPMPAPTPEISWPSWAAAVWLSGLFVVFAIRLREWLRLRTVVRASAEITLPGITIPAGVSLRATSLPIGPGIVGWWRCVLLVPAGLERLPRPQLDAVIAHELCHVRRRDTLAAAAHMLVEALFWFHPLVWWIGSRLIKERECACDEDVLALGIDPVDYSSAILSVCRRYVEAPIAFVHGVTGSDLRRRIQMILTGRVGARLSLGQRLTLGLVGASTVVLPISAGVMSTPVRAQRPDAASQRFEIASIKPCSLENARPSTPAGSGASGGGAQSNSTTGVGLSPGRAYLPCIDVSRLIQMAYVTSRTASTDPGDPINNWPSGVSPQLADGTKTIVRGGPAWAYSEKFTIEAKTPDGGANAAGTGAREQLALMGPMLQSLLEDRFQLKLHRETEQASMFALVVSKNGLKVKPLSEGGCAKDRSDGPVVLSEAARLGVKPTCGTVSAGLHDGNWRYEHGGQPLSAVAAMLSGELGVTVLDRTGVSDLFNLTWEFAPDDSTPRAQRLVDRFGPQPPIRPTAPPLRAALDEQLGVSLMPIKEPRAFFVIDRVERPSPNLPAHEPNRR